MKFETVLLYLAARFGEIGTWRAIALLLSLGGSRYASFDWGQCASIATVVYGVLHIIFPDVRIPNETALPASIDADSMRNDQH